MTRTTWLTLGLTSFFWALMFYLGKHALTVMTPEVLSAWRFLLGALVLLPWVGLREGIDWRGLRRHALPLGVMAVVGIGGFNLALFHGMRHTSAMNGALIMALCPLLITVFGALLTREAVQPRQLAGLASGLSGVLLVISGGSWARLASLSFAPGDLLVLLAAACWALYSVIPRRFIPGLPTLQVTTASVTLGGVFLGLNALLSQGSLLTPAPLSVLASVAAMGLFGSGVAYLWWNAGVRAAGPGAAAVFMNLVPVFTALIGVALGQPLTPVYVAGTALVLAGVWLSTFAPGRVAVPAGTMTTEGAK